MRTWTALVALALALALGGLGCSGSWENGADGGPVDLPDAAPSGRHHPVGFADSAMHGPALKTQAEDCRLCHGQTLAGVGATPSCDGCHQAGWRTNCVYCHGGTTNQTGAPPRQLSGATTGGSFPPHDQHVVQGIGLVSDCNQCHVKAIDVLSPGHVFDVTPSAAEVDLGAGRSPQGVYAAGTCSNTYCHGNGRADNGTIMASAGARDCASCHPSMASNAAAWQAMSGLHRLHLALGDVNCGDCHNDVTTNGTTIAAAALHVDGRRQVAFSEAGIAFDAAQQRCTGACHGHDHGNDPWAGAGVNFHPDGWSAPEMHGPEMTLQRQDCRGCHGADLTGGLAAEPSCDSCHAANWRTDCVYCHGGELDGTGAPPRDLGAAAGTAAQSFVAHTKHVGTALTAPIGCVECHTQPVDVLSVNHAFDATDGVAEVTMAGGRSDNGNYGGNGTCDNLYCHGNGRADNGTIMDGAAPMTCGSCHAGIDSGQAAWATMSGEHRKHLQLVDVTCGDCHMTVASADGTQVIDAMLHIDGLRAIAFTEANINWDGDSCTGACHGENHNNEGW